MVSLSSCYDGYPPHMIGLFTPPQLLACRPARTLQGAVSSLHAWFYASAAVYIGSSLFWDVLQCRFLITDVSGQRIGSKVFRAFFFFLIAVALKMGAIGCTEIFVTTNLHHVISRYSGDVSALHVIVISVGYFTVCLPVGCHLMLKSFKYFC